MVMGPQPLSSVSPPLQTTIDHGIFCQEGIDNLDSHGQFVVSVMVTSIISGENCGFQTSSHESVWF